MRYGEPDFVWCLGANVMHAQRRYEANDPTGYPDRDLGERAIFADRLIGQAVDAAPHSFQLPGGHESGQHNGREACPGKVARAQQRVLACELKDGLFAGLRAGHERKYVAKQRQKSTNVLISQHPTLVFAFFKRTSEKELEPSRMLAQILTDSPNAAGAGAILWHSKVRFSQGEINGGVGSIPVPPTIILFN